MKLKKKKRTLFYRKAEWVIPPSSGMSFEEVVRTCLTKLPTVATTIVRGADGQCIDIRHRKASKKDALYLHIAVYTPDEQATIASDAPNDTDESDLVTMKPHKGHHILDYDAALMISGNNVVLCFNGLKEGQVQRYFNGLFVLVSGAEQSPNVVFTRRADVKKLELIRREGVKHIDLNVNLYETTMEYEDRKGAPETIRSKAVNIVKSFAKKDLTKTQMLEKEYMSARIVLKVDGRKKDTLNLGYERLEEIAKNLVENDHYDNDGFFIVTKKNKKIRSDDISLSKPVSLDADGGKTIIHTQAWEEQKTYLKELVESRILEL